MNTDIVDITDRQYSRKLLRCCVCGGKALHTIVDLSTQAIASRFPKPGEPDAPHAPLGLAKCQGCGFVQLTHVVDGREIWREGYGYRSSVNETMRAHLQDIAHSFIGLLSPSDTFLDIGCNDGELLRHIGGYFPGVRRIGVDPLGESVEGAEIIRDFFGQQALPRCKIITSIAMFYDLEFPVDFAKAVARTLTDDGIWCLEVGYLGAMLEGAWDGICHEHLGYYGLRQLREVGRQAGLVPAAVTTNKANGGSVRVWFVKRANAHDMGQISSAVENQEVSWDLRDLDKEIGIAGKALRRTLVDLHAEGKSIMVLGASTKGNTLLQSCLSHDWARTIISAAVERYGPKVGRTLPGSRVPIISEVAAQANPPDYFLVLPWHFKESILTRGRAMWPQSKFIFPLPKLEILP